MRKFLVVERYSFYHDDANNPRLDHLICRIDSFTKRSWLVTPLVGDTSRIVLPRDGQHRARVLRTAGELTFDTLDEANAYVESMFACWAMICADRDSVVLPLYEQIEQIKKAITTADVERYEQARKTRARLSRPHEAKP